MAQPSPPGWPLQRLSVAEPLLDVRHTAERLGIGETKLRELLAAKVIPSLRVGRSIRVVPDRLEEWIEQAERAHDDR
jgi:excisionase family DNA binding protein